MVVKDSIKGSFVLDEEIYFVSGSVLNFITESGGS
jgi:hypothetical protein